MRYLLLRVVSLLLASASSWVGAQSPTPDHYRAFFTHFEAAVASRDLGAIEALYQTNSVTAQELKLEMARWPDLLAGEAKERMAWFFKELSTLPPQAREAHTGRAHRLTKHEVTHLASLQLPSGFRLTLPLVLADGRLLIVPSEKRNATPRIEQIGPANERQPDRSGTNQTSSAAGPRR